MNTNSYELKQKPDPLIQFTEKALMHWGLQGSESSILKQRENIVCKIVSSSEKKYVMRIHRADYHTDDELRSELQWMQALDKDGIEVPQIVPTSDGRLFILQDLGDRGVSRQVDLFEWLEGSALDTYERNTGNGSIDETDKRKYNFNTIGRRCRNPLLPWRGPANAVENRVRPNERCP